MATFLARMVTSAKWKDTIENEICADAVTADLRTQNNTLSFWSCEGELERPVESELKNIVIALAAGRDRLEKLDVVCLLEADIVNSQIEIRESSGVTPAIERIRSLHRDIIEINLPKLVKISELIQLEVTAGKQVRFTKKQVKDILQEAIAQELLETEQLKPKLADVLGVVV